jgi:hypothetical protein
MAVGYKGLQYYMAVLLYSITYCSTGIKYTKLLYCTAKEYDTVWLPLYPYRKTHYSSMVICIP